MMHTRRLIDLKDFQGDHLEYEEYFRRMAGQAKASEASCKEIMQDAFSLLCEERSSTVIECAMKLIHAMGIKISPSVVQPLIEIGDVLEVYSAHARTGIIEESQEEEWYGLINAILKMDTLISAGTLDIVARATVLKSVRDQVRRHLKTVVSVNAIRLASVLLKSKEYFIEDSEQTKCELCRLFEKYVLYLGNEDIFLSKEATFFLIAYKKYLSALEAKESDFYRMIKEIESRHQVPIQSFDNYLRNIFYHLPPAIRTRVSEIIAQSNCAACTLSAEIRAFLNIQTLDNHLAKKTIRCILLDEDITECSANIDINFSEDSYINKDLSHLFSDVHVHASCIEY
ncbi:hypothetical protein NEAUS07_1964 [Nematocida ausubeli]|nr:hypothetical protein NEAUS07_1964 [Nematocida ausubeli]